MTEHDEKDPLYSTLQQIESHARAALKQYAEKRATPPSHELVVAADAMRSMIHRNGVIFSDTLKKPQTLWECCVAYDAARSRHASGAQPSGAPAPASAQGEIKACPFCGGPANEHARLTSVRCLECGARGPLMVSEGEHIAAWNRRAPAPSPASGGSAIGQGYGSIFAACADRLAWARVTGPDGSAKPCTDMEAIRAVHALLDDHDMIRAEVEKWRGAASQFCGAHVGVKQGFCPACERDALRTALAAQDSKEAK